MIELLSMNRSVPAKIYVDDVFSAYVRTGTGASATITTGNDISGKGGLVVAKSRSAATGWKFTDTARGVQKALSSNSTAAESTDANGITAFSSTGHTVGSDTNYNNSGATYIDYEFCKAANFFDQSTATVSGGVDATVSFPALGTLGMVIVKNISTGSWYVWHRSLTAGKLLYLEQTAAEATLGHITVSGTTVTLEGGVIDNGDYIIYACAHDTGTDGIIQCGSFSTDGSGNATVTIGWEIQYAELKVISTTGNWIVVDTMRGMPVGSNDQQLYPNLSDAEASVATLSPTATGFKATGLAASQTYVYKVIRRPNKPPTSGTQVYNAIARSGTGVEAAITGVGFTVDVSLIFKRTGGDYTNFYDRMRGNDAYVYSQLTNAESTTVGYYAKTDQMDGVTVGAGAGINGGGVSFINWFFRRAPGVFDEICYDGSASNKTEAVPVLGAPAELWVVKSRSGATQWVWGSTLLANTEKIVMPTVNGRVTDATAWNSTYPTSTTLSLGTSTDVNNSGATYVAWLWATLAGISKVGTYDGNGTSQPNDCGFSAGARFVMIIRATASTAQDIFIWDTVRGIVAGNDPHLSLNSTSTEVTTDDSIDPFAGGFIVNQNGSTNINVNGATYIFLAYA